MDVTKGEISRYDSWMLPKDGKSKMAPTKFLNLARGSEQREDIAGKIARGPTTSRKKIHWK